MDNRFFGSFVHGIDAKGRLIIPNSYREKLGHNFTVCPTDYFNAIAIYPRKAWLEKIDQLERKSRKNNQVQTFIERLSRLSFDGYDADVQGRLLLPQRIRSFCLKDAREVEISGAMGYIKIMNSAFMDKEDERTLAEAGEMVALVASISLD